MQKGILIGVDVGGTKIQAGAITIDGIVTGEPVLVETKGSEDSSSIFGRISYCIELAIRNSGAIHEIAGVGMGVTGPLDNSTGTILECPQLPTMHFFPLRERVFAKFKIPVAMDNDANALLLGESMWGAGKGSGITLGFTLGTGLGCAIVSNGRLFSGANGLAGEIWPSPYKNETIEDVVSGRGVSNLYAGYTGLNKSSKEIAQLAYKGDKDAIKAWNAFGQALGYAIAWGINLIDPDLVILGGSIANSSDLFYGSMDEVLRKNICPVPASKTKVVRASLGDNAGFIGAAALLTQGVNILT